MLFDGQIGYRKPCQLSHQNAELKVHISVLAVVEFCQLCSNFREILIVLQVDIINESRTDRLVWWNRVEEFMASEGVEPSWPVRQSLAPVAGFTKQVSSLRHSGELYNSRPCLMSPARTKSGGFRKVRENPKISAIDVIDLRWNLFSKASCLIYPISS